MEAFQERVIVEKQELDVKLANLELFIDSPLFQGLSTVERLRLERQKEVMEEYSEILNQRIDSFK